MNSNIKVKILENIDKDAFNKFVEFSPFGDILQYWEWGETKRTEGWKPLRIAVIQEKKILLTAQILLKKIPLLGNYGYIPHGPIFHHKEELDLALGEFNKFLIRQSKNYNFICIEIEPRIGQLTPVETEKKSTQKSYVDKVFKKDSKEFLDDPIGDLKQISMDAKIEDEETLEIDSSDLKIEKIKTLKLGLENQNSQTENSKNKKHYTNSFYNLPLQKLDKDKQNLTENNLENKIKTSNGVEIITKEKNPLNELLLEQKEKKRKDFNKNRLPLKAVNLRSLRYLPTFKKEESSKELEQDRVKNRAKNRLKQEFDAIEILGEKNNLLQKDVQKLLKKPAKLFNFNKAFKNLNENKQEQKEWEKFSEEDFFKQRIKEEKPKIENDEINNLFSRPEFKKPENPEIKIKEAKLESISQPSFNQNKKSDEIKIKDNKIEIKKSETFREIPELKENSPIKNLIDPEILQIFQKHGYDLTGRNMQPKHKLYYDLNESEEDLLAMCKKSTRYNIKYAAKKGVKIEEFSPDDKLIKLKIQKFYNLLLETQQRASGYPIRPIETFFNLFKSFRGMPNLSLFEASYENEVIVINISQKTKYWSSSFYAGSNRKHPKLKAPYLLRWESILAAKNYGSKLYDFWGIIPNSENHKGYSDHKLSFGGIRVDNYGLLAFPISPIKYSIWDAGIWLRTEGKKEIRKIYWNLKAKIKQFFEK